jgi:hypothetical protein
VKTAIRVADFTDRRSKKWQLEAARVVEQNRADMAIERLWSSRVKENVLRRIAAKVNHEC